MNYTFHKTMSPEALTTPLGVLFAIVWLAVIVWSLYWKGRALWKAARLYDRNWFIVLLLVNLFGLLEIFYIYSIAKPKEDKIKADLAKNTSPTQ